MTQRREIEGMLTLYDDLSGILGAMRSFALAELHRVTRREEAQQKVVKALTETLQEVTPFLPPPIDTNNDVWLLFGSVRGFCGSFNEDVVRAWQTSKDTQQPTIVIGERLLATLPDDVQFIPIQGAEGALDAAMVIDRILMAIDKARGLAGESSGLVACLRDEKEVSIQRLLPLPVSEVETHAPLLMNEPAARVATGVAEQYLFHLIMSLLLRSIRVENHMRLMQMENALQHLERGSEDLRRQRNRLRQEEIVEEIELMARKRVSIH